MGKDFTITIASNGLPSQIFNGKEYYLYPKERYFSKGKKRMHIAVYELHNGKIPKGFHVHHINSNTWDNTINNLELVKGSKHLQEHGKKRCSENKEWFKNFHSKGIEKAKEWHKSTEGLQWHSEHGKLCWNNRETVKRNCNQCGKEYETYFPSRSKFCHNNCKAKALRNRRK